MSRARDLLRENDGLTLIEVMVAVLLLSGGLLGTLSIFNSGERMSSGTRRAQSAYSIAQTNLEALVAMPWATLALDPAQKPARAAGTPAANLRTATNGTCTTAPTATPSATDCTRLAIFANPDDTTELSAGGVTSPETLVFGSANGIGVTTKDTSSSAYTVYRYVTEASDSSYTVGSSTYKARRVMVAVQFTSNDQSKAIKKPVWVSTVVIDPATSAG